MTTQDVPRMQVTAAVIIAAISVTAPGLQPMLLGALLAAGKIGAHALGLAATVEALGVVVSTALIGAILRPRRLRLVTMLALLAVMVANVLTITLPPSAIIPLRGLAGLGNGLLVGAFLSLAARSRNPTSLYATLFMLNASVVFLLSMTLGAFAIDRLGPSSGYMILTGIYAALLLAARLVPDEHAALPGSGRTALPPGNGVLGLCAVILFFAGVMAFWVYAVPLGTQIGIPADSMQLVVAISTGVQIVGGMAAIALATKLTGFRVVVMTSLAGSVAIFLTMTSNSLFVWVPALLTLAFCWTFGGPFHAAFLIGADPTRRGAVFVGTAQLFGTAIGPLLGSILVSDVDYRPAWLVSLACYVVVLAIAIALRRGGVMPSDSAARGLAVVAAHDALAGLLQGGEDARDVLLGARQTGGARGAGEQPPLQALPPTP